MAREDASVDDEDGDARSSRRELEAEGGLFFSSLPLPPREGLGGREPGEVPGGVELRQGVAGGGRSAPLERRPGRGGGEEEEIRCRSSSSSSSSSSSFFFSVDAGMERHQVIGMDARNPGISFESRGDPG